MYVHVSGKSEPFSIKKAQDELASIRKSISVIREIIGENSIVNERDIQDVTRKLETEIGTVLEDEPPTHVTFGTLSKIKTVIASLFYDESAM